jgi:hypothetical protein
MTDALVTAQCVLGLINCETIDQASADTNCSSTTSMTDALLIAQKVLGLIASFPC